MKFQYTKTLTSNGKPIKVHAISTGLVAVKSRFRDARFTGLIAAFDFMLDKNFTEWMPIWVWVIEHEEGVFVIDTGENCQIHEKDYFKPAGWFGNWFNNTQFKFKVSREQEIDQQLLNLGIEPKSVHQVILTHRHLDHVDGIRYFEGVDILVHRIENEKPYGDLPHLYPDWFEPILIDLEESFHSFPKTKALTNSGDFRMIHTAGHTHGHCSFSLETDEGLLFFGGDISYNQQQFLNDGHSGGDVVPKESAQTYKNLKALAQKLPLVYLPSHDAEAGERLMKMEAMKIKG
jgi:glyoxylase-like metal-dependent hydrolase (beta-lactamase superfamily II)